VQVSESTMETTMRGVFAAGDVVSGPSSVAQAIGSGRNAAISIDRFLTKARGNGRRTIYINIEGLITACAEQQSKQEYPSPHVVDFDELLHVDYFDKKPRNVIKKIDSLRSSQCFEEIVTGYDITEASDEADRCFHCGHCFRCGSCVDDCPGYVLSLGDDGPVINYPDECWHCGNCRISCPCGAVSYNFPLSMLV